MSSAFASGVSPEALLAYHQNTSLEEGRAGGWDPAPRLVDMALDGVAAEVIYTSVGFGLLGLLDGPFQAALFRAYNDWLAEFCAYAPAPCRVRHDPPARYRCWLSGTPPLRQTRLTRRPHYGVAASRARVCQ